jgi:hypothetical protein
LNTEHTSPFDFLCALPIGPHIRAAPAASLAGKQRLQIGQSDIIRPLVAADRGPVRATIIGTIDHQAAHARGAHLGKGDLLRSFDFGHGAIIAPAAAGVKPLDIGPSQGAHTMARFLTAGCTNVQCSAQACVRFLAVRADEIVAGFDEWHHDRKPKRPSRLSSVPRLYSPSNVACTRQQVVSKFKKFVSKLDLKSTRQ